MLDALNGANWQRSGGKGKRPQAVPRPGYEPAGERIRPKGRPVAEMSRFLDDWNAGRLEKTYKPKSSKVVK